jgi:hypothetical protein
VAAGPSNGQANLTWQASPGAVSYNVYRGTTAGGEAATPILTGITVTSFTDTGLTNGQTCFYKVSAVDPGSDSPTNLNGESALSTEVSVMPGPGGVSGTSTSSASAVDLTAIGTSDWAHWGASFVHKATGASQISNDTVVGSGTATAYNNDLRSMSWSDGTPTSSGVKNTSGDFITGIGKGFSFTAPADPIERTLTVYVGGSNSGGTLVAKLSDGSGPSFTSTTATASGRYDIAYTITYYAASPHQKLTVTWTQTSGTGNVTLSGAALSGGGSLSGAASSASTGVNLATAGNLDWAHWGVGTAPGFDHKSTGGSQISNYTAVGAGSRITYNNDPRPLTFTGGTPVASSTATTGTSGVYVAGIGKGFSISVPASTTPRTLTIYVGGWDSGGTLTAHLSDNSAASFVATVPNVSGQYDLAYALTFSASSANKRLIVTWTMVSGTGNVTLQGAVFSTPAGNGAPASASPAAVPPAGLVATATINGNYLAWAPVAGAVSYNIYRATSPGLEGNTPIATGATTTNFTDNAGTLGVTYYYKVTAVFSDGSGGFIESPFSNEASTTFV